MYMDIVKFILTGRQVDINSPGFSLRACVEADNNIVFMLTYGDLHRYVVVCSCTPYSF